MKKTIIRSFFILLCIVAIISSCNREDDDLQLTGLNGKPSSVGYDNNDNPKRNNIFFYYQGDKLSQIKELKGSISKFNYENNELVSIDFSPEDKEVMDGHGAVNFKKEGQNKIIIESWGEPSFELFRMEIELDGNNRPTKITEVGFYSHNVDGVLSNTGDGYQYTLFTYEPSTNNLLRQTIYSKETDKKVVTYEYEYDGNVGAFSKINLPLWYYAYMAYVDKKYNSAYSKLFFNYTNNLVKETVHAEGTADGGIFHYTYQYNNGKTPVFMQHDIEGLPSVSITY